ncbi:MAG: hypothetical protein IKN86_12350 [Bacteroidaceae bacterium]|jgi:hypothetical protein|nr:hypothetical protein [Bacteroidaceae bacterium]
MILTEEDRLALLEAASSGQLDLEKCQELSKRTLSLCTDKDLCQEIKKRGYEVFKWDIKKERWVDFGKWDISK